MTSETSYAWLLFGGYFLTVATLAWRSARGKSFQVFAVGSRELHPAMIGLSVAAASTSTATFVINPGLVYLYGWSGFVAIYIASTLGFLVGLVFFSKSFRRIGERFSALTLPQWIGERYGSDVARVAFGTISLLQVAYLVLVAVAITVVMAKLLATPVFWTLAFVVIFTSAYILVGGAGTHVLANTVQSAVIVLMAAMMVGSGWTYFREGLGAFFDRMAAVGPHYAASVNPDSQLYRDFFEVIVVQFVIGFAATLLPHLIAKPLYLRRESDVNVYLASAAVAVLIFKSVLITGIVARFEIPGELLAPDAVIATYLVEAFAPAARAVIGLGVLAAGFSTLEGILLALSSIFASDLVAPLRRLFGRQTELTSEQSLRIARIFIAVLAPILIYLSYDQIVDPQLSVIIFAFNGILAATAATFLPVFYGIYGGARPVGRILLAAATALTVHYGMILFEIGRYHDNPMVPAAFALTASVGVFLLSGLVWRSAPEAAA